MYKFISKGDWFKKGTECTPVELYIKTPHNKKPPPDETSTENDIINWGTVKEEEIEVGHLDWYFGRFKGVRVHCLTSKEYECVNVCELEDFEISLNKEIKILKEMSDEEYDTMLKEFKEKQ